MPDRRCVVIGGGITGMTAAILMAEQGHDTTIVEASNELGPLLRGFDRSDWHYETGFHYAQELGPTGALRRWFSALGLDLEAHPYRKVTEMTETGDGLFLIPGTLDEAEELFPDSIKGYKAFCGDSKDIQLQSPYLTPGSNGSFSPFTPGKKPLLPYLERLEGTKNLKDALLGRCLLYGVPPERAAKDDFFLVSGHGGAGLAIRGGGQVIAQAFINRIKRLGIRCVLGKAVTRIRSAARHVQGVETEDIHIPATIVIYSGNPPNLRGLLPNSGLRPAWFSHLELMERTPQPVVLYGICDSTVPELHAWYLTEGKKTFQMLEDVSPTMCVMTGEANQRGEKTCMIMGMTRNTAEKQDLENLALKKLPILKGSWRKFGAYGGNAMQRHIYGSDGSIFGYSHTYDAMPVLPLTKMNGLFLAGQCIQLPGLLGCIISAAIAVSLICGQEKTLRNFRECAGA